MLGFMLQPNLRIILSQSLNTRSTVYLELLLLNDFFFGGGGLRLGLLVSFVGYLLIRNVDSR